MTVNQMIADKKKIEELEKKIKQMEENIQKAFQALGSGVKNEWDTFDSEEQHLD